MHPILVFVDMERRHVLAELDAFPKTARKHNKIMTRTQQGTDVPMFQVGHLEANHGFYIVGSQWRESVDKRIDQ
jgi:alkylated DNA nucleotide flippase Atl1